MILLIDNYDSFTWNLVQMMPVSKEEIQVVRNDEITPEEIEVLNPEAIVFSPGPGRPEDAGNMNRIIESFYDRVPMLGICLGHQAIAQVLGGKIVHAKRLVHGKEEEIVLDPESRLFGHLHPVITGARYHSLVVDPDTLPDCLIKTAVSQDGEIMAFEHKEYPVFGLQFHPESIMTSHGREILQAFTEAAKGESENDRNRNQ